MKITLLALSLLVLSNTACAYTKGKTYKLTILHTNDHHGHFWPNKEGELGLAARATLIKELRDQVKKDGGHVLLVDAGDVNTGTPQSDMLDAEPDFKGMAELGYDVMALGNHEFDNSLQTIFKQRKWAGFPFISANIYYKNSARRVFPSHIVKEVDDLKVTIMGLTTEDTPIKSNPLYSKDLRFVPVVEEAQLVPLLERVAHRPLRPKPLERLGEQREVESHQSVGAHLQEHAGQDDRVQHDDVGHREERDDTATDLARDARTAF